VRAIVSLSLWHAAGRRSGDERRLLQGAAVASALIGVAASVFRWQWYAPGNTLPIADTCQLLGYAVLIATMMRLQAAGRSVGSKWIIWIESLSVGVSVGLLAWHFIVRGNYTYSTFGATIGPTLELVYPILDSLLIVLTFDLSRGRMRVNLGWVLAVVACCLGDAILSIDAYVTSNPAINAMGDILGSSTVVGFAVLAQQASTRRPLVQSSGPSLGFVEHLRNPMSISAAVLVVLAVSTATVSELAGHGVDGILWLAGLAVVALIRFVRVIIIAQERAGAAERIQRDLEGRIAERMSELANLTEARTRLVATMSHEIRSPLNAILGLTHLMTVRDDVTPSQRETLGRIQQHGRHLVRLSENVLAMARIESGTETLRRDPFDLDDVLLQTMDVLRRDAEAKGLRVTLERPADLPRWLVGDQTRLTQLLLNYVSNAVKATTQGGITLRLFASAVGERVELTGEVSDTGPGIPPENLTQLFQRFERLAGATGPEPGSGLGLAICRWIAEQMEGAVGVRSVLGGGTTFWFRVLLDRQPATAGAPAPQVPTSPPGRQRVQRGARVLVVDDIPVNREIAREVLTAVGMDVVEADGGRAAVRLALSEPFDAVLMDLRMPDMDGFTATQAIRRDDRGRTVPIIAMTAVTATEDVDRSREAGMSDWVSKPFEPDTLLDVVLRWTGADERSSESSVRVPDADALRRQALFSVTGLDAAAGLRRVMENQRLYEALLAEFVRSHAEAPAELERCLARGDRETAQQIAHTLRGVAGGIGATDVHASATRLDQALRAGDVEGARMALRAMQAALPPLVSALRRHLPT
jgi:signal transduction histidine kinase/DNA-binding response OmpR family regulator